MVNLTPWRRRGEYPESSSSLLDLRSEMDRLFDHFFESSGFGLSPTSSMTATSMWTPALEIFDEDNNLTVRAEVPGMKPEDIEINVSGNELTISGEKREESEHKREGLYRSERRYGRFFRSIELPADVDTENVSAEYDSGVLTLRIPRTEAHQPRKIEVKSGSRSASSGDARGGSPQPGRRETAADRAGGATGAGSSGAGASRGGAEIPVGGSGPSAQPAAGDTQRSAGSERSRRG